MKIPGKLTRSDLEALIEQSKVEGPIRIYVVIDTKPKEDIILRWVDKFTDFEGLGIRYSTRNNRVRPDEGGILLSLLSSTNHIFTNFWFAYVHAMNTSGKTPKVVT